MEVMDLNRIGVPSAKDGISRIRDLEREVTQLREQLAVQESSELAMEEALENLAVANSAMETLLQQTADLYDLSRALATCDKPSRVLEELQARAMLLQPEKLVLFYVDTDAFGTPQSLTIAATSEASPMLQPGVNLELSAFPLAREWTRDRNNPLLISDLQSTQFDEFSQQAAIALKARGCLCLPLTQSARWIGIVVFLWEAPRKLDPEATEFARLLPSLVAPVVDNLRLVERLEKNLNELAQATALARENARLKSEFLATMSHELRTPMNAIEGFTSIMLTGMGGVDFNDAARRYIERVQANSKRLLGLINDFLDLSRIESGRLQLAHTPVSPAKMVKRWQEELGVLPGNKGLEFNVMLDEAMPETLYGDEEQITRIATNLIGNAAKFTEQGGVSVKVLRQGDEWRLEVTDTGIGIPPHARDFIFEEFRQVDMSSKRKHGGTGLGLAIVQKLARAMGGMVTVESEVGVGSTFTVTLPLGKSA
jgi:signal transduction histidine kinase